MPETGSMKGFDALKKGLGVLKIPFTPIPSEWISHGSVVRARIQEVIDYIDSRERLLFSDRLAIGIALLKLAGQMRSVFTPAAIERYLEQRGFITREEVAADGQP